MLSSIACAVDLPQSLPFRPINVAKLEGVSGSIRKVSELGIAETVQAPKLLGFGGNLGQASDPQKWRPRPEASTT